MTSDTEKDLAEKLKSSNSSEIYDALLKIRKSYVRNQYKMKKLQKYSVIKLIIPFIEHPKFCNISLSIIADGCLEQGFVNEVIKCDGLKSLMRIMKSFVNDDIQNRACRALGNMAKFDIGFKAVHHVKPVSNIISFLSETNDVNCQQTAVRTLMILGKSSRTRELIVRENGLVYIAKLLHSTNVQVLTCSIKALANLTHNCSISCARQLLELHFHKVLVELHSHSEKSVRNHALISLKNLSSLEEIRSGLVKVGAVKLFTEVISTSDSREMSRFAALALCRCLDHIHMWSHNGTDRSVGLKALLAVLRNKQLQDIHIRVIASLIPLSYEFKVTDILLSLDVLQVLIEILRSFIDKHKCKSTNISSFKYFCEKDLILSDSKQSKENEEEQLELTGQSKLENDLSKEDKNSENFENILKNPMSPEKFHDVYLQKGVYKWDSSLYGFSSVTSDYSGSCSPTGMCSPVLKYSTSPEVNYDIDVGSPSTGHTSSGVWSPVSLIDESMPYHCWSPVVSTHSNSPVRETEFIEFEENEDTMKSEFSLTENLNSSIFNASTQKKSEVSDNDNLLFLQSFNLNETKNVSKLKSKLNSDATSDDLESITPRKKLKTDSLHSNDTVKFKHQVTFHINVETLNEDISINSELTTNCDLLNENTEKTSVKYTEKIVSDEELKTKQLCNNETTDSLSSPKTTHSSVPDIDTKLLSDDNEQSFDLKLLNENIEQQTIDHFVILFILQLSYHIEKKTNSQMADKSFFSVLIDYLCLIHKPSLKAETVLLNLIKNRYCFEKLILNGFFCELEEKMILPNYTCVHCSNVKLMYNNLVSVGRQEIESDYGIGTLLHILITSERKGQLHAICTLSKLVTEKSSLYRLLFEANGLSLLLSFLSDYDVWIKKKTVMSLCQLYQSLTKQQKIEKCCFEGTCAMKTSTKCFYKESFLNVTFSVGGGVKILANREKVCENSDYFKALLQGNFRESNAGLVTLPHISAENLSTIFHFLHGCGNGNCCPYITRIPFSVLLELLSDCEKFLLVNVKSFVEDRLCHRLLPSVIPKIYKQSKMHNSPALAKRTLHSALNLDPSQKDLMWACFKELLNLEASINIYDDIEELMRSLLL